MNGFSAADMSTAAASAHNTGYQAGYADAVKAFDAAQPAAAQEAVDFYVCDDCGHHYMEDGINCDCIPSRTARPLRHVRMAPVAAAPTDEDYSVVRASTPAAPEPSYLEYLDLQNHSLRRAIHAMMAKLVFLLDEDQFADIDAIALAAGVTPAAPGIDLARFRDKAVTLVDSMDALGHSSDCRCYQYGHPEDQCNCGLTGAAQEAKDLLALIDASLKGGQEE